MYLKRMLPLAAVYYKSILLVVALITVAAFYRLGDLTISISGQDLMVADTHARAIYEASLETYGSDEQSLLIVQDAQLFDPDKLSALRDTLTRIESLPYVQDTLRPGQVFGVTALAAEVPRPVTMVATKNSELLALRWDGLRRIGHLFPYLSAKLYRNVSAIIGKRLAAELEHIDACGKPCGEPSSEMEYGGLTDKDMMIKI